MKKTIKRLAVILMLMLGLAFVAACSDDGGDGDNPPPPPPPPPALTDITLEKFTSHQELSDFVGGLEGEGAVKKEELVKEMSATLDAELKKCRLKGNYDDEDDAYYGGGMVMDLASPSEEGSASGASSPTYTTTNIQEAGVDEADIVKTSGDWTYVLGGRQLHIINTWPKDSFKEVSKLKIEGLPISLYVKDELVTVISKVKMASGNKDTKLTFVNVGDKASPEVVRESFYEGNFIASRRIDGKIFIVTNPSFRKDKPELFLRPDKGLYPECKNNKQASKPSADFISALNQLKLRNVELIEKWLEKRSLPRTSRLMKNASGVVSVADYDRYSRSKGIKGDSVINITRIDIDDLNKEDAQEYVVGQPGIVYASEKSIYIATGSYASEAGHTVIHRFELVADGERISYFSSGVVEGELLNQFSMSEYEGRLRVAAKGLASASVYVLDAAKEGLPLVGRVDGIGEESQIDDVAGWEEVKAVRFVGERGFVVTFRQIDPLYVIDLSDPVKPVIAGELKVPGFSTYLHLFDRDHLIGLGRDADAEGTGSSIAGVKLSMFDVTDNANPKEDVNLIIGDKGTYSVAIDEHLAFTFDKSRGLLAIPVTLCEAGDEKKFGYYNSQFVYDGVQVYKVGADSGFELVDEITLPETGDESADQDSKCYADHFGGDYAGGAQRSVIMGDDEFVMVVVVAENGVKAVGLGKEDVGSVNWENNKYQIK